MLVTLKTLQQQTFKIDIDPDETVSAAGARSPAPGRGGARGAHRPWAWGGAAGPCAGPRPQLLEGPGGAPERGDLRYTLEDPASGVLGPGRWMRPAGSERGQGLGARRQAAHRTFRVGCGLCGRSKGKQWSDTEALVADGVEYTRPLGTGGLGLGALGGGARGGGEVRAASAV